LADVRLSVVIVNINQKELLRQCLRTVSIESEGTATEVIVVDNGSSDGSREMLQVEFPQVRLVCTEGRKGFAENHNAGICIARGEFVLVLNNDTWLVPLKRQPGTEPRGLLGAMVARLANEPRVAAMGALIRYPDGRIQNECARSLPTLPNVLYGMLRLHQLFPRSKRFGQLNLSYWDHLTERSVDSISGACMLLRRSILDELGAFDERYFVSAEDADLCARIRGAGHQILYCPQFEIVHVSGQTLRQVTSYAGRVEERLSIYKYFLKHHGRLVAMAYRALVTLLVVPRIAFLEMAWIAPLLHRSPVPWSERLAACSSLLHWRSMYTGQYA
jgi:GT2 family glycosyltransferase